MQVEDYYRKNVRSRLAEEAQKTYDWVNWFVRMRWFDYLGMGFLLLRIDATINYWTSVYLVGHLSLLVLGIVGVLFVNPIMRKICPKKKNE